MLSTTNMARNNNSCSNYCGAMQHGLGHWLATELNAAWDRRIELQDTVDERNVTIAEFQQTTLEQQVRIMDLINQREDLQRIYEDLVERCVRNRLSAKQKIEDLEDTNQRLTRLLEIQTNEAKGLARALRRSRIELEEARNNGWVAKKAKHE